MGELDGQGDDEAERQRRSPDDAQPPKESINEGAEHIDLAAVQDDDALIDALNRGETEVAGQPIAERELGALLMAWRQDLDTDPLPETSRESIETAVAEWPTSLGTRRRRPMLVPLATAAAVLAIAFTGVGVAARDARPGDTLWGLTRVLYSEQAASVEAATTARSHLDLAQAALRAGEFSQAKEALEQARLSFDGIGAGEDKATLLALHERLLGELNDPDDGDGGPPTGSGDTSGNEPPPHIAESSEESASEEEPPVSVVTTTPETTTPSAPEPSDPSPTTPPSSPPDASDPDPTDSSAPDGSRSDEESPSVGNRISIVPGASPEDATS
ncbi:hypothetical protein C1701_13670 [Actinoalloteichus sp. AHMU CJ021]|uniref:anti-sigma-D factor RsdA n=1 Tax=Actinoalloteichus TaxID=65496 RepID=UPI0006895D88|nr:anti-sigma-D factor RsdA [Actinoalloteichus caeruleus]AUS79236.1 hypothetical protein C1701_13670 [Actinoalloteichus sp. AHMU CJ021]